MPAGIGVKPAGTAASVAAEPGATVACAFAVAKMEGDATVAHAIASIPNLRMFRFICRNVVITAGAGTAAL